MNVCKRICKDGKQTYTHKTYSTSMDKQPNASEFLVCVPVFKNKQIKESQDSMHQTTYTFTGSFPPKYIRLITVRAIWAATQTFTKQTKVTADIQDCTIASKIIISVLSVLANSSYVGNKSSQAERSNKPLPKNIPSPENIF